jgi:hypothetical protein
MAESDVPAVEDIAPADIPGVKKPKSERPEYVAKKLSEVATEVAAGKWGVGRERDNMLIAAGWQPVIVRAEMNRQRKAAKAEERKANSGR